MKIVVVGAAGLIGTKTVGYLRARGHEVVILRDGIGKTRFARTLMES